MANEVDPTKPNPYKKGYLVGANGGKMHIATIRRILEQFENHPDEKDPGKIHDGTKVSKIFTQRVLDNYALAEDGKTIIAKPKEPTPKPQS